MENGLTEEQVAALQEKHGPNKLREKKKKTTLQRFIEQFKDVMILILIAAAIISFVVVCVEKNWGELFEPALILLIVILNAIMGVYQEGKAEKALDALKNMSAPHARVIRDGKESIVVDTHMIRISNRIGLVETKDPYKIELALKKLIPAEEGSDFCHRIVIFGREICPARKPKCDECPMGEYCKKVGI